MSRQAHVIPSSPHASPDPACGAHCAGAGSPRGGECPGRCRGAMCAACPRSIFGPQIEARPGLAGRGPASCQWACLPRTSRPVEGAVLFRQGHPYMTSVPARILLCFCVIALDHAQRCLAMRKRCCSASPSICVGATASFAMSRDQARAVPMHKGTGARMKINCPSYLAALLTPDPEPLSSRLTDERKAI